MALGLATLFWLSWAFCCDRLWLMHGGTDKKAHRLIYLALVLATTAAYWQAGRLGFVNFDDPEYITENDQVRAGLTWEGVVRAFTSFQAANWHPLAWLSHMLDCQIFGVAAGPHHLVSVALHILNSLLLFRLLNSLTNSTWRSATVAAMFALHPAHVESVAWLAERKDVLSTWFGLLALLVYARYVRQVAAGSHAPGDQSVVRTPASSRQTLFVPPNRNYWAAFLCFALSLMSKPMLVTLPWVLLLLDWWPLRRFARGGNRENQANVVSRLVLEKWPWFALSVISCALTIAAQNSGGAMAPLDVQPLSARLANSLVSCVRYLGKLIWPTDLAIIYPLPSAWPVGITIGAAGLLMATTIICLRWARRWAYLPMGWFWFLGTLVPVIGLIQVGRQAMADRYTYFPSIGFFILMVWAAADFFKRVRAPQRLVGILTAGWLIGWGGGTAKQTCYWRDSVTLFERAVAVTAENAQAQNNLGFSLQDVGRSAEAKRCYAEAVRIAPDDPLYRKNLGLVLAREGDTNAANVHLQFAIQRYLEMARAQPESAETFNAIGIALNAMGERREAANYYAQAVRHAPRNSVYRNNLGVALARQGDVSGAIAQHEEAIRLTPKYTEAYINLGAELVAGGRLAEAVLRIQQALRSKPNSAEAHNNLGGVLARMGRDEEAILHYAEALRWDPKLAQIHLNLGLSLLKLGQLPKAVEAFSEAARLDNKSVEAAYNLGKGRVLLGQFETATATLTELVNRTPTHAAAHLYLGKAWIGLRQPEAGIEHLRESLRLRPESLSAASTLAWVLATDPDAHFRNGEEAIRLTEPIAGQADRLQPSVLDALAAAYAEVGRFDDAVITAQSAGDHARLSGDTNMASEVVARIRLYQGHQPYRSAKFPE